MQSCFILVRHNIPEMKTEVNPKNKTEALQSKFQLRRKLKHKVSVLKQ